MVSVVIPTFQRESSIARALEGVINQTYSDIEIIVVDDNGEGTEHQLATKHAVDEVKDSRIRYISHQHNLGGCAARNTGIKNALGDYVGFLDDDDIWSKMFIEEMLKCFTTDDIGAVYCDFYSYNGIYSYTSKERRNIEGNVYSKVLSGWCPESTSLFIVKKSKIISVGMFDDSLMSFQDYDMWLRLSQVCEFAHCKKNLVLKYEGFGEQTSMGGYSQVVKKYSDSLSKSDYDIFLGFIRRFGIDTLYRTIIYKHKHKLDYTNELKEYFKEKNTTKDKLRLYAELYLPPKMFAWLIRKWSRGNFVVYEGKYPV